MRFYHIWILVLAIVGSAVARTPKDSLKSRLDPIKSYWTARVSGEPPHLDGVADEEVWNEVPWQGGDFRQRYPDAGAEASVETWFKVLYDDRNIYVAIKALDPNPDEIVRRMSRRDDTEGDWVSVSLDSYYDKRTAFRFIATAAGVKGDEYVSNNGENFDESWDPIWYLKTSVNKEGWMAEFRIPLSQLRFADKPEHVWGIQVERGYYRIGETSLWQYIPPDGSGWVHGFADLKGIKGIRPQKQLEIQPYILAKTETFAKEEGNPFVTGKSSATQVGVDAKIGITSDVTLDLTVNPDFGQVEADPSQLNLSAFELFFRERRPFFIEGSNILDFPITDFDNNNVFYSRRIGRRPQVSVDTDESGSDNVNEYVKRSSQTPILGAAKLTGKNKNGLSWAVLESVTSQQDAIIDSLGVRRTQPIEPETNYLVGRAQQDINKGNTLIGGIVTATNRNLKSDPHLNQLPQSAYTGGVDMLHQWQSRKYYVSARAVMSRVNGPEESITALQTNSERYFQRPDNNHANVDSTRRSLTGSGGMITAGKRKGNFVYDVGYSWLSPELELNGVGFLSQTDQMNEWVWASYRVLHPIGMFRSQRYSLSQSSEWDFDGRNTGRYYQFNGNLSFANFWSFGTGLSYHSKHISNANLRGGPSIHYPANYGGWAYLGTDGRKRLRVTLGPSLHFGDDNYTSSQGLSVGLSYRPMDAMRVSVEPGVYHSQNKLQYVTTGEVGDEDRYVVARIEQNTVRLSVRMTYSLTPNLSIQYWGQPFGTAGQYMDYKYVTEPTATELSRLYTPVPAEWMTLADDTYQVDENEDGTPDYTFDRPDFNFGQFRSNMVVRWEYVPGSALFLVWTQEMNGEFYDRPGSLAQRYAFNFDEKAHNIFLLKFTYRFVM